MDLEVVAAALGCALAGGGVIEKLGVEGERLP